MAALEAYSAGVNARLAEINEKSLGRGAPEMFLFEVPISPWQPADSLALIKLMAVRLSPHLADEVLRARASLALDDPARLADIMPEAGQRDRRTARLRVPDAGGGVIPAPPGPCDDRLDHRLAPLALPGAPPSPAPRMPGPRHPNARRPGGTLLANDPHLGFSAPAIWYLARIELESRAA